MNSNHGLLSHVLASATWLAATGFFVRSPMDERPGQTVSLPDGLRQPLSARSHSTSSRSNAAKRGLGRCLRERVAVSGHAGLDGCLSAGGVGRCCGGAAGSWLGRGIGGQASLPRTWAEETGREEGGGLKRPPRAEGLPTGVSCRARRGSGRGRGRICGRRRRCRRRASETGRM